MVTSLVLRGKMGVGKTKIGEVIGSLLGAPYKIVSEPRYVTGRFNCELIYFSTSDPVHIHVCLKKMGEPQV